MNNRSISNKSIFGEYKNPEDRVTAALLQIFKIGGPEMMGFVFDDFDVNLEAEVNTQVKKNGGKSRPDGELKASYHLYIESKVRPWADGYDHNVAQLSNHEQLITGNNAKLLYITVEEKCPAEIVQSEKLYWMNWKAIVQKLRDFEPMFNKDVIKFLVDQFSLLVDNVVLSKFDDTTDDNRVVIVGGRFAEDIALKYGFYACQAERKFRKTRYIAFYFNKRIQHVFKIVGDPIQVKSLERVADQIREGYVLRDEDKQPHTFFRLGDEIVLDHEIRHAYPNPYVQRQRYTSLERLQKAMTTDEL